MKRYLSLGSITQKLGLATRRFPVTLLLVAALAGLCFYEIYDPNEINYRLWLFTALGALWSIAAALWAEGRMNDLKTQCTALAAILLWGAYCYFCLPVHDNDLQTPQVIQIVSLGAAALPAIFFISFLKKETDRAFWNFTVRTITHTLLAGLFALVLFGGLNLALVALRALFQLEIAHEVVLDIAVACFVVFAPLYLLANIPDRERKQDTELPKIPVLKVLGLYILTPILGLYAVILYAYLFKILATWELPDGWVSSLVTVLAGGGLPVIACLFPWRTQNRVVDLLSRWFGVVILPLLVLMTIGIARRIGDYGLTINRCYILLVNIWFYGIYLYLFLTSSRHIKWIVISPVVLAILASTGPWSAANTTRHSITHEVDNYLNHTPISIENPALDRSDTAGLDRLRSNIYYLYDNYGEQSIRPFFTDLGELDPIHPWSIFLSLDVEEDDTLSPDGGRYFSAAPVQTYNRIIEIPAGFDRFVSVDFHSARQTSEDLEMSVEGEEFVIRLIGISREFRLPLWELTDYNTTIATPEFTFLLKECSGYYYEAESCRQLIRFSGRLFYKQ